MGTLMSLFQENLLQLRFGKAEQLLPTLFLSNDREQIVTAAWEMVDNSTDEPAAVIAKWVRKTFYEECSDAAWQAILVVRGTPLAA